MTDLPLTFSDEVLRAGAIGRIGSNSINKGLRVVLIVIRDSSAEICHVDPKQQVADRDVAVVVSDVSEVSETTAAIPKLTVDTP